MTSYQYQNTDSHDSSQNMGTDTTSQHQNSAQNQLGNSAIQAQMNTGKGWEDTEEEDSEWLSGATDFGGGTSSANPALNPNDSGGAASGPVSVNVVSATPIAPKPYTPAEGTQPEEVKQIIEPVATDVETAEADGTAAANVLNSVDVSNMDDSVLGDAGDIFGPHGETGEGLEGGLHTGNLQAEWNNYLRLEEAAINDAISLLDLDEKRTILGTMGYSGEMVDEMSPDEIDESIAGSMANQFRWSRVMDAPLDKLDEFPLSEQRKFLEMAGISMDDLMDAPGSAVESAFIQVVTLSKIPGNHMITLEIDGGWWSNKHYDITIEVTEEGNISNLSSEERTGGAWSYISSISSVILPILAGIFSGGIGTILMIVNSAIQAVNAVRSGNWLGFITALAGGIGGITAQAFRKIAQVARFVERIGQGIQSGMDAIQSGSLSGLIGAIGSGAGVLAGFLQGGAATFALTLESFADELETYTSAGEGFISAANNGDIIGAIVESLELASHISQKRHEDNFVGPVASGDGQGPGVSSLSEQFTTYIGYARYAGLAYDAITSEPRNWYMFASNVFLMADELRDNNKLVLAAELSVVAGAMDAGIRNNDPQAFLNGLLDVIEVIDRANTDLSAAEVDTKWTTINAFADPAIETYVSIEGGDFMGALDAGLLFASQIAQTRHERGFEGPVGPKEGQGPGTSGVADTLGSLRTYAQYAGAAHTALTSEPRDWFGFASNLLLMADELEHNDKLELGADLSLFAGKINDGLRNGDPELFINGLLNVLELIDRANTDLDTSQAG